jgi:hypothetical protein
LFGGNPLGDDLNRSFEQHTQHRIGIRVDLASHADRLREEMLRVKPAGGNPAVLNATASRSERVSMSFG